MKAKIIIFITLLGLSILFAKLFFDEKQNSKRLYGNFRTLVEQADYYQTQYGLSAASVEQLTLTHAELRRHYDELVATAESLNLKIRRLETAARTVTNTVVEFRTEFKDSIIYAAGRIDTIRCASYRDDYVTFELCDEAGHIAIGDTLVQFVHRVPRQWWFIKFGTAAIRQEIISKNPYTEIVFTEYIKLKRR